MSIFVDRSHIIWFDLEVPFKSLVGAIHAGESDFFRGSEYSQLTYSTMVSPAV